MHGRLKPAGQTVSAPVHSHLNLLSSLLQGDLHALHTVGLPAAHAQQLTVLGYGDGVGLDMLHTQPAYAAGRAYAEQEHKRVRGLTAGKKMWKSMWQSPTSALACLSDSHDLPHPCAGLQATTRLMPDASRCVAIQATCRMLDRTCNLKPLLCSPGKLKVFQLLRGGLLLAGTRELNCIWLQRISLLLQPARRHLPQRAARRRTGRRLQNAQLQRQMMRRRGRG